jgi:hypothetical protein
MFSTTLAILATLLAPFALIVGAVVSVMRRTEDDEFAERLIDLDAVRRDDELIEALRLNMTAPTEPLGQWLALLRDEAVQP